MPSQPRLKVIKVPLDYEPAFHPIQFTPMPRLYLEFLENKNKVKPELRNKEYIPKLEHSYNLPSLKVVSDYAKTQTDENTENIEKISSGNNTPKNKSPISSRETQSNLKDVSNRSSREEGNSNKEGKNSVKDGSRLQILDISKMSEEDIADLSNKRRRDPRDNIYKQKKSLIQEYNDNDKDGDDIGYKSSQSFKEIRTEKRNLDKKTDSTEKNLLSALKGEKVDEDQSKEDFLNITSTVGLGASVLTTNGTSTGSSTGLTNASTNASINGNSSTSFNQPAINIPNLPPSISEINSGKVSSSQYRDLSNSIVNEDELSRKRKILSDLERIKKHDKDANVPKFSELTDINTLEREYANIVRNLHIDSNVENYKKWLTMGFVGLEYFLVNWIKFEDIKGFSSEQLLNMNKYEKILVEIGEKSYVPEEKRLAPEIRLIGVIAMNAAIFVGMKMLSKSMGMGSNMFGSFMNNMGAEQQPSFNQAAPQNNFSVPTQPKKKMPPPNINLDDLNMKKNE